MENYWWKYICYLLYILYRMQRTYVNSNHMNLYFLILNFRKYPCPDITCTSPSFYLSVHTHSGNCDKYVSVLVIPVTVLRFFIGPFGFGFWSGMRMPSPMLFMINVWSCFSKILFNTYCEYLVIHSYNIVVTNEFNSSEGSTI